MINSLVADWTVYPNGSRGYPVFFFRGVQPVDLMFPLVAGFGNSHNSLDLVSNLNSSRSDWVLVYATRTLSVLRQKDISNKWTFSAGPIHRFGAPHGASTPNNRHVAAMKVDGATVRSMRNV